MDHELVQKLLTKALMADSAGNYRQADKIFHLLRTAADFDDKIAPGLIGDINELGAERSQRGFDLPVDGRGPRDEGPVLDADENLTPIEETFLSLLLMDGERLIQQYTQALTQGNKLLKNDIANMSLTTIPSYMVLYNPTRDHYNLMLYRCKDWQSAQTILFNPTMLVLADIYVHDKRLIQDEPFWGYIALVGGE